MICLSGLHPRRMCRLMLSLCSRCDSFERFLEARKSAGDCLCGHCLGPCTSGRSVGHSHQPTQGLCGLHLGVLDRSQDAARPAATCRALHSQAENAASSCCCKALQGFARTEGLCRCATVGSIQAKLRNTTVCSLSASTHWNFCCRSSVLTLSVSRSPMAAVKSRSSYTKHSPYCLQATCLE